MSIQLIFIGGKRTVETIAATAGDVITNLSPHSTNRRWLVLSGRITLVADATVANRSIRFYKTDGTNITEYLFTSAAVTAGQTRSISHGEVKHLDTATILDNFYAGHDPILIEGADQFRIQIGNGVAGDSYSGYVVILEVAI